MNWNLETLAELLRFGSGLSWTWTYLLLIRQASRDRLYAMPIAAAAANIAWELLFSFVWPASPPQLYINLVWFGLDVVIVGQCWWHGRVELGPRLRARRFDLAFCATLAVALLLVAALSRLLEDGRVAVAFLQNLMMSALFCALFRRRRGGRGQSPTIAAWKLLGTLLATLHCLAADRATPLVVACGVAILALDARYRWMLRGDGTATENRSATVERAADAARRRLEAEPPRGAASGSAPASTG